FVCYKARNSCLCHGGLEIRLRQLKQLQWIRRWPLIRPIEGRKSAFACTTRHELLLCRLWAQQTQISAGEKLAFGIFGPRPAFKCTIRESPPTIECLSRARETTNGRKVWQF